jgi:hypothetical protein
MKLTQKSLYITHCHHQGKDYAIWTPPGREWTESEIRKAIKAKAERTDDE